MMHHVLIAGAGKIGSLIACLLVESGDYQVYLADKHFDGVDIFRLKIRLPQLKLLEVDVENHAALAKILKDNPIKTIISSLPYFFNIAVAKIAQEFELNYFDLTEDVAVTTAIKALASTASGAFVPQCGLAPGFINIVANSLMQHFEDLDTVKLRVGALPKQASNALKYALTWSTDGLINEYGNACHAIENGEDITVLPLEGLETLILDGEVYEAFNTSGGLASLAKTYAGKVKTLNYKTLRYPGHCQQMKFLMNDLRLNQDRQTLKRILENAIPITYQDIVIIYVSIMGLQRGQFVEENYIKKISPQEIAGLNWSAIQVTTATSLAAVVDIVLNNSQPYRGLILQEQFSLQEIIQNRFGRYYR